MTNQLPHPKAASGGNSSLEDAACLAECLDWASRTNKPVSAATKAFEDIRQPRVRRMQEACHEGVAFLGASSEDEVSARNQMLAGATKAYDADLSLPEEERRSRRKEKADMHARFPSEPYLQWLYGYDAIAATKEYLAQM